MKAGHPPRLALALLDRCVPDEEPLIGDLLEERLRRSDAWFWRQVVFTVLSRTVLHVRTKPFLAAERVLVTTAIFALLGFCTVVVATLMTRLIVLGNAWSPQTGRYQALQLYFTVPAFAGAILMGRAIGRLHHNHRVICVLGCSITATIASCLNLYLFVPNVLLQPLVPHAATQIAVGVVFIAGLFVGIGLGSLCEPQSSS
jgi:hypothetical protein